MEQTARTTFWWTIGSVVTLGFIALWLNYPPGARFMVETRGAWPFTEVLHFLGLAGFIGFRTVIDLRLTNRAFSVVPLRNLIRKFMPATVIMAAITVITGMALYTAYLDTAYPETLSANPLFQLKLLILAIALFNLWYLHAIVLRTVEAWNTASTPPRPARVSAYLSMIMWGVLIVLSELVPHADWALSPWVD